MDSEWKTVFAKELSSATVTDVDGMLENKSREEAMHACSLFTGFRTREQQALQNSILN